MKWKHRLRELDLQSVALKSLLVRETNEMETHKRGRRQIRALVIRPYSLGKLMKWKPFYGTGAQTVIQVPTR